MEKITHYKGQYTSNAELEQIIARFKVHRVTQ